MSPAGKGRAGGNEEGLLIGAVALVVIVAGVGMWLAAVAAADVNGARRPPGNPVSMLKAMAKGRYTWPADATIWAAGGAAVLAVLAVAGGVAIYRRAHAGRRIDRSARNMTRDPGLRRYSRPASKRSTPGLYAGPGPVIGRVVPGKGPMLRATWEDMLVLVAGPRTGKTTAWAIPAILEAPGAVIVTSNKRDIVDATRATRPGGCWVFDPQGVAGAGCDWWWNPLDYVVDVRSARKLARVWTNASTQPDARGDAYFDDAGAELLAGLLLAAAAGGRPVSAVYSWLSDPDEDQAVGLLRAKGYVMAAEGLRASINLPDKQRAGVYGTAAKTVSFLADPRVLEWVTDPAGLRPRFDPSVFVGSADTLYSLSREGEGSSGPLVTALTAAVLEAAEGRAAASTGGRLATPMLAVLDEVANVCRWRELPDLYSHYGSRGIVVLAILQSWAQGESCWGEQGMRKLWDAANVKIYGGGTTDTRFLEGLSQLFGHYDRRMRSRSSGAQGSSTSWSAQRERVFSVDDLSAMPPGRAAVALSGTRPVLVASVPWMARRDANRVQASVARYGTPEGHRVVPGGPGEEMSVQ